MATTSTTSTGTGTTTTQPIDYLGYLGTLSPSPFDPNTVINALLSVQQQPITNLQTRITNTQQNQSIYASLGTDVTALQTAAFNLTLQSISQARTATSSNTSAVTATATPNAQPGTYTIAVNSVATPTTASSTQGIGATLDSQAATTPLQSLNVNATPTAGSASVVVDGQIESFNVDPTKALTDASGGALTTLQQAIAAGLGVDASTVSVGVSNNKVTVNIAGATQAHTISFGASGDSSNFLQVMNLTTAQGSTSGGALSMSSSSAVATAQANKVLTGAQLATPLNAVSGSFNINGVAISWNAGTDALNDVLNRINNSSAGVSAQYNSASDTVQLTNKATGQAAMSLQDVSGNFLTAMNLAPGSTTAQTLGKNASITINGTTTVTSATNSISNAVPGLKINALQQTTAGQPITLTVGTDVAGITKSVQTFVDAANKALNDINLTQQKDATSNSYSQLFGDTALIGLRSYILNTVTGMVGGSGQYQSLQDIGITTGAVGQTSGVTPLTLQLDTTKFSAALTANPGLVAALFNGTTAGNGFQGVAQQMSPYLEQLTNPTTGIFAEEQTTTSQEITQYRSQVTQLQNQIAAQRTILTARFSAMTTALSNLSAESSILGLSSGTLSGGTSNSSSSSSA